MEPGEQRAREQEPGRPMWIQLTPNSSGLTVEGILRVNRIDYHAIWTREPKKGRSRLWAQIAYLPGIDLKTTQALLSLQAESAFSRWSWDLENGGLLCLEAVGHLLSRNGDVAVAKDALMRDFGRVLQNVRLGAILEQAQGHDRGKRHGAW